MYEQLDIGIIEHSKIRYWSSIVHQIFENTSMRDKEETIIPETRTMVFGNFKKVPAS